MEEITLTGQSISAFREFLVENEKARATVEKYVQEAEQLRLALCGAPVTKAGVLAYRRRRSASSCGSRTVRHFPFSRISVRPARRASVVMKRSSLTRIPVAQIVSITWYSRWFLRPLAMESSRRYSDSVRSRCSSRNARR